VTRRIRSKTSYLKQLRNAVLNQLNSKGLTWKKNINYIKGTWKKNINCIKGSKTKNKWQLKKQESKLQYKTNFIFDWKVYLKRKINWIKEPKKESKYWKSKLK